MAAEAAALPAPAVMLDTLDRAVTGLVLVLFAALAVLAFTHAVNWDEFHFLALVQDYSAGRPLQPLQTFHVHFFGWLTWLPGDEAAQITAGRLAMVAMLGVTSLSIFHIGRTLAGAAAARIAVLVFLTSGFMPGHGADFRADPMAAALMMGALALVWSAPLRLPRLTLVALILALAVLITIKAVLYLPAFLAVLVLRASERRAVVRLLGAALLAMLIAAGLLVWHRAGLTVPPDAGAAANARDALFTTLLDTQLFPRSNYIALWVLISAPGLTLVWLGLRAPMEARLRWGIVLLVLPVAVIAIYRNAFPYFFPYILPPAAIVAALGVRQLSVPMLRVAVFALALSALAQGMGVARETRGTQDATLAEVHRLFPAPVPYISGSGMVASFPDAGFFMSSWGVEGYRRAGQPRLAQAIATAKPPFVLADRQALATTLAGAPDSGLLPTDTNALRRTYVHYWGAIWLAGRDLTLTEADQKITLAIPGRYRLETSAEAPIRIDGTPFVSGAEITVGRAPLTVSGRAGMRLRLIWATPLGAPPPLGNAPLYYGFWSL